jgi:hypothetical protein
VTMQQMVSIECSTSRWTVREDRGGIVKSRRKYAVREAVECEITAIVQKYVRRNRGSRQVFRHKHGVLTSAAVR